MDDERVDAFIYRNFRFKKNSKARSKVLCDVTYASSKGLPVKAILTITKKGQGPRTAGTQ